MWVLRRWWLCRGDSQLLGRTAQAADVHPTDPRAILLHGGWSGGASAFCSDMVLLRTDTLTVESLTPAPAPALPTLMPPAAAAAAAAAGGGQPSARGYHVGVSLGGKFYIFGGRTEAGVMAPADTLWVYDPAGHATAATASAAAAPHGCWLCPAVAGQQPEGRSSHRALALGDRCGRSAAPSGYAVHPRSCRILLRWRLRSATDASVAGVGLRLYPAHWDPASSRFALMQLGPAPQCYVLHRILFHGGTTGGDGERLADVFALQVRARGIHTQDSHTAQLQLRICPVPASSILRLWNSAR